MISAGKLAEQLGNVSAPTITKLFKAGKISGTKSESGRVTYDPETVKLQLDKIGYAHVAKQEETVEPDDEVEQMFKAVLGKAAGKGFRAYVRVVDDVLKECVDETTEALELKLLRHLRGVEAKFKALITDA